MIAIRFRQIALLLLAMAISLLAFFQMFERTTGSFPMQYALMLGAGMGSASSPTPARPSCPACCCSPPSGPR